MLYDKPHKKKGFLELMKDHTVVAPVFMIVCQQNCVRKLDLRLCVCLEVNSRQVCVGFQILVL